MKSRFTCGFYPGGRVKGCSGFSLVEVMVATALIGIGLGGIMMVNSQILRMAKDTRHTNAASLMLQARVEQMRNTSWDNMTSASHLKNDILAQDRAAGSGIPGAEVRIKVAAYNPHNLTASTTIEPIDVKRAADGTVSILTTGGDFDGTRLARVDVAVSWTGTGGRERKRESSTIISNNGISKNYVPMMGTFAGGAFDNAGTDSGTGGTDSGSGSNTNSGQGSGAQNGNGHVPQGNSGNGAGNEGRR